MAGEQEVGGGRGRGDQRRQQATLMELLCFGCWNTEIHRLTERVVEAHHRRQTHANTYTLWRHKQTHTVSHFQVTKL